MSAGKETVRAIIFVRGQVQQVGFRWWTRARALELGLTGHARNMVDGRVEVSAQGTPAGVETLHQLLSPDSVPQDRPGRVDAAVLQWQPIRPSTGRFVEL